ncbi:MAG: VOC family protein [Candidatus Nanopelagicales bacterium]
MSVQLNPYLNFRDQTRAAMEFYQSVFSGQLTLSTFGEYHASEDPAEAGKIMHAQLVTEHGLVLMASDTPNSMEYPEGPSSISISLSGDDESALSSFYEGLLPGGSVVMPLEKAAWGDWFGMLIDKFGVSWLVNITGGTVE